MLANEPNVLPRSGKLTCGRPEAMPLNDLPRSGKFTFPSPEVKLPNVLPTPPQSIVPSAPNFDGRSMAPVRPGNGLGCIGFPEESFLSHGNSPKFGKGGRGPTLSKFPSAPPIPPNAPPIAPNGLLGLPSQLPMPPNPPMIPPPMMPSPPPIIPPA